MVTNTKFEDLYDKRIKARNIKKSLLTQKDYEKFLKSLPDDTEEGEPIVIEEENLEEKTEEETILE